MNLEKLKEQRPVFYRPNFSWIGRKTEIMDNVNSPQHYTRERKMKIVFHLKNGDSIERFGCSKEDMNRLVSQFNNDHLMRIENLCINPREVVSFILYE